MTEKDIQPQNRNQSELEEPIELREKNKNLDAEIAYLKKVEALKNKKLDGKKK